MKCERPNCEWTGPASELEPLEEAGIFEIVSPGEIMPRGRCPQCGAVAHEAKADPEPYGYVYRLRYSPDHWSHQLMFSEAANFALLPAEDVKEVTRLYAGSPPEVETALRYAYAAIESLLAQVQQMRGIFKDEDGAIQRAVDDGDAAIEDIAKALAKIA